MPSKGKTIKVHKLTHFSTSVKLHGDPSHYNAGPYEHNNIIVKQTYRATNKQLNGDAYLKQMVHAQKRARLMSEVHAEEVGPTSYNTAYVKVRDSLRGCHSPLTHTQCTTLWQTPTPPLTHSVTIYIPHCSVLQVWQRW